MKALSLRRRPLLVRGIPIVRETLDLNAETPRNLQIEKPPRFTLFSSALELCALQQSGIDRRNTVGVGGGV
jgi:hypothetical protein